jgi:hypothetical protein
MKSMKILSVTVFSLMATAASAQYQAGMNMSAQYQSGGPQGYQMPGGTLGGNYQPSMQPGAYQAPQAQGPGEHMAYQSGGTQPCSPRGGYSSIEGPIANGALIAPSNGSQHN